MICKYCSDEMFLNYSDSYIDEFVCPSCGNFVDIDKMTGETSDYSDIDEYEYIELDKYIENNDDDLKVCSCCGGGTKDYKIIEISEKDNNILKINKKYYICNNCLSFLLGELQ